MKTDVSFAILIDELPICVFDRDEILCSRPIDMDQHSIKNVNNPTDRLDAVNKAYADRIALVERLADDWIATSSPMFATQLPGCHKFSRGTSLMTYFSGSPARHWTRHFRLDYVEL